MDTVSVHLNTATVQPILDAFRAPQAYTGHDGDWVILGYPVGAGASATTIDVLHQGTGGLRACREYIEQTLRPDNGIYVLVRYDHMVEMGKTVKFAYVSYTAATGVPPMRRALLSTHRGQVQKLLLPHHTSIDTDSLADLDDDSVREKIGGVSGTKSHVSEKPVSGAVTTTPWSGTSSLSSTAAHDIPVSIAPKGQLSVAPDLQQALADARAGTLAGASANDAMWVIARYAGKNTLALLASGSASNGSAGAADWLSQLEANNNNFVFVRLTHQIDKSTTVKYAYVRWQPESVPPMAKSQVSTNKGLYDSLFSPFHVDFQVTATSEISDAMILDKISSAAGTKNNVKAN